MVELGNLPYRDPGSQKLRMVVEPKDLDTFGGDCTPLAHHLRIWRLVPRAWYQVVISLCFCAFPSWYIPNHIKTTAMTLKNQSQAKITYADAFTRRTQQNPNTIQYNTIQCNVKSNQARWFKKKRYQKQVANGWFIWKTLLKWMIWWYHHLRKHLNLPPANFRATSSHAQLLRPQPQPLRGEQCAVPDVPSRGPRRSEGWVSGEIMPFELSSKQWKQNPTVRFHEIGVC